jgi:hypothetical protein
MSEPTPSADVDELSPGEVASPHQEVVAEVRERRRLLDQIPDGPRPRSATPYRRTRYMIDLPLQLNYVSVYLTTIVLLVVGFIALNYVFAAIYQRALKIQQLGFGSPFVEAPPQVTLLLLVNFVFVMLLLIGAALYAVIHSHRVAGPAYRLRMALRKLHVRDYDDHVQLRRKDFLHELAEQVNVLNQAMKAKDLVIADAVLRLDQAARATSGETAETLREVGSDLADLVLPVPVAEPEAPAPAPQA